MATRRGYHGTWQKGIAEYFYGYGIFRWRTGFDLRSLQGASSPATAFGWLQCCVSLWDHLSIKNAPTNTFKNHITQQRGSACRLWREGYKPLQRTEADVAQGGLGDRRFGDVKGWSIGSHLWSLQSRP